MKLNAKSRSSLRSRSFALPKERKYPVHDRAHAANAKSRATQQYKKGNLSESQYKTINKRADSVLRRKK